MNYVKGLKIPSLYTSWEDPKDDAEEGTIMLRLRLPGRGTIIFLEFSTTGNIDIPAWKKLDGSS